MAICKKKSFDTKKQALSRLEEIRSGKAEEPNRGLKRTYLCPHCGKWHFTSMSKTEQTVAVKRKDARRERDIRLTAEFFAKRKGWNLNGNQ